MRLEILYRYQQYEIKRRAQRRLKTICWAGKKFYLTFALPRPDKCDNCGNTGKIDSHHVDYFVIFKWFGIRWLCVPCHMAEGYRLGQKKNEKGRKGFQPVKALRY